MQTQETSAGIRFDQTLDAKGLNCPLPVLKAKLALNRMQAGEILHVEATDPHSIIDFQAYCARTGHEIIQSTETDGVIEFFIRRAINPNKI
jgi:tRNA 2-thiouridine synthesizing protein A